jgi:hypothetical protein
LSVVVVVVVVVVRGKVEVRELTGYGISFATARGYLTDYFGKVHMGW